MEEIQWLTLYLDSLELVDKKSDMFRFPFEDSFLAQFKDKFLDNLVVANNMLQAFALIKKCLEEGVIEKEDEFNSSFKPEFFSFASNGFGNCYLWQDLSDDGLFYVKVTGYISVADYIFRNKKINVNDKLYPLLFMLRNTLELCLKRFFYIRVDNGIPKHIFFSKRKSHLIKKDLWKNVKPVLENYASGQKEYIKVINIVEKQLDAISSIDKNGDTFRYPTSYSFQYKFNNVTIDLKNVYEYFCAIINFLDNCDLMLNEIVECQDEMRAEYESEILGNIDW